MPKKTIKIVVIIMLAALVVTLLLPTFATIL